MSGLDKQAAETLILDEVRGGHISNNKNITVELY